MYCGEKEYPFTEVIDKSLKHDFKKKLSIKGPVSTCKGGRNAYV